MSGSLDKKYDTDNNRGQAGITQFMRQHICNKFCRMLKLSHSFKQAEASAPSQNHSQPLQPSQQANRMSIDHLIQ